MFGRKSGQFAPHSALIKPSGSVRGDRFEGVRQIGVKQLATGHRHLAVGHENRTRLGVRGEILLHMLDPARQALGDRKAITGIDDRALQTTRQR